MSLPSFRNYSINNGKKWFYRKQFVNLINKIKVIRSALSLDHGLIYSETPYRKLLLLVQFYVAVFIKHFIIYYLFKIYVLKSSLIIIPTKYLYYNTYIIYFLKKIRKSNQICSGKLLLMRLTRKHIHENINDTHKRSYSDV